MDLSFHQLHVFVAVARNLSFSRAAEELLLTQPAVSMQIKALERGLGIPLIDHVGKRIQLTEAGQDLYVRATRILGLATEAVEAMADLRQGRQAMTAYSQVRNRPTKWAGRNCRARPWKWG